MEITINTENKTIKVIGQCNVQDLTNTMLDLGLDLLEYTLIGTETLWQFYPYGNPNPCPPWEVTCTDNINGTKVTYNTEPKIS